MKKEACIIFSTKIGDGVCLGKNRDRMYDASICVIRALVEGTEVCIVLDAETGWVEGLNEHGIGIVNTALMVLRDEAEGVKGKGKGKSPLKSKDGPRIFRALGCKTVEEAVASLTNDSGGVKGHTFVASPDKIVSIEASKNHEARLLKLDPSRINTRTNHGVSHPDAGYTKGDDFVSSVVRRWQAQKLLQDVKDVEKAMPTLLQRICDWDSPFNMVRETAKMRTTSQMTLDLASRTMLLYIIPSHCKFLGVRNYLPEGHQTAISLKVMRYNDELHGRGSAGGSRDPEPTG